MKKIFTLIILIPLVFCCCSSGSGDADKPAAVKEITSADLEGQVFLSAENLEKAGFDTLRPNNFCLFIEDKHIYVAGGEDGNVARFTKQGKPEYNYKKKGEGPAHFFNGNAVFRQDDDTIAVFDAMKKRIFFFDNDLNFNAEHVVSGQLRGAITDEGVCYGHGSFGKTGNYLALLDENYQIKKTFAKIPPKSPHGGVFVFMSYRGYSILGKEIAASSWVHFKQEDCKIDVMDVESQKIKVSLKWIHPRPLTAKDVKRKTNMYGGYYFNKHGEFYVVQNTFDKTWKPPLNTKFNLYIFNPRGKLLLLAKDTHMLLNAYEKNMPYVYFFDEDGNIRYLDLKEFLK